MKPLGEKKAKWDLDTGDAHGRVNACRARESAAARALMKEYGFSEPSAEQQMRNLESNLDWFCG